jgi:hypothetical protein
MSQAIVEKSKEKKGLKEYPLDCDVLVLALGSGVRWEMACAGVGCAVSVVSEVIGWLGASKAKCN